MDPSMPLVVSSRINDGVNISPSVNPIIIVTPFQFTLASSLDCPCSLSRPYLPPLTLTKIQVMTSGGWINLEETPATAPETPFFEGDPSFRAHSLTPRKRVIYFAGLYVVVFPPYQFGFSGVSRSLTSEHSTLVFLQLRLRNGCQYRRHIYASPALWYQCVSHHGPAVSLVS